MSRNVCCHQHKELKAKLNKPWQGQEGIGTSVAEHCGLGYRYHQHVSAPSAVPEFRLRAQFWGKGTRTALPKLYSVQRELRDTMTEDLHQDSLTCRGG